jgi:biopolymer transport protein TolR
MAASAIVSASGGSASRRGRRRRTAMSEINVTPLVDVMLVLLVIFMVTAPLMTLSIKVDLPDALGGTVLKTDQQPVIVTLKKQNGACTSKADLYIGHTQLSLDAAEAKLKAIKDVNPNSATNVMFNSDKDICYSEVAKVLGRLRDAGLKAALNIVPEKAGD